MACLKGDAESIAALARAGCDKAAKDNDGYTALMAAACSGSAAAVQAVLDLGGAELEARDKHGAPPSSGVRKGDAESIAALARAGCDKAAKDNDGDTALMLAACSGSAAAVQAVLDLGGAELEARNKHGAPPSSWRAQGRRGEHRGAGAGRVRQGGEGQRRLHCADAGGGSGSAAAVQAVLDLGGAELEARDEDGRTAFLWRAARETRRASRRWRGPGATRRRRTTAAALR